MKITNHDAPHYVIFSILLLHIPHFDIIILPPEIEIQVLLPYKMITKFIISVPSYNVGRGQSVLRMPPGWMADGSELELC
jgi:hypothetical protein